MHNDEIGEASIVTHVVANSLDSHARPRLGLWMRFVLLPSLWLIRRQFGGIWVGGNVYLTPDAITFAPNDLNAGLHEGSLSWSLRLRDLTSVKSKLATATGIIEIGYEGGVRKIRCYGAEAFAKRIEAARQATQP